METGLIKQPAWRRSYLSSHLLTTVLALVVSKALVAAQVDINPREVTLMEGDNTTVLCRMGEPLDGCQFQVPGEKQLYLSDQWPSKVPGYSYYGQGLASGQCGVIIERITAKNHGKVKCMLVIKGEEFNGVMDLLVALPPHRPEIEITSRPPRNFYEADEVLQARCISRDGRPASNISWFLNDEPITQGLSTMEITETPGEANTTLFMSMQAIQRRLLPSDDGKFLVCRSSHIADRGQDNMVKQQLIVKYRPVAQPQITVYGLTQNQVALINVTIQSNPRPRVEWSVSGVVIPQGTQNGRYEAYEPNELGNGEYNIILSIDALTLEDTTKDYYLRASNELGQQEYIVRITSSNEPEAQGLLMGEIVAIIVAVIVLFVVVGLVVVAWKTGRWCFGDRSSKSPTSETSDTESAEYRSTKFKKLPKFHAIFKKKNPSAQQSNTEGMNAGQNEDEQRLASVGTESAQGAEGQDTREDKQLVYAELVLKPSDDKPAPSLKDPTEYAEIMHVQKPTTNEHPPNTATK